MKEREKKEKKERTPADDFRPLFILVCVVTAIIFAAGMFVAMRYAVNEFYNYAYGKGYYLDRSATTRMRPQIMEGYVPFYNTGNHDYQNGRFEQAVNNYMKALEDHPPHTEEDINEHTENECRVRINLALSMLARIDFENLHMNDREEVDNAIKELLAAREVLTTDECAHFDDPNGHNGDAEQLKKEIDEVLKRLNYEPPQEQEMAGSDPNDQQSDSDSDDQQQSEQSRREKELEKKLNDEMSDAKEEQERSQREREKEMQGGPGGDEYGYGGDPNVQSW